jgi:hypothetical protein
LLALLIGLGPQQRQQCIAAGAVALRERKVIAVPSARATCGGPNKVSRTWAELPWLTINP